MGRSQRENKPFRVDHSCPCNFGTSRTLLLFSRPPVHLLPLGTCTHALIFGITRSAPDLEPPNRRASETPTDHTRNPFVADPRPAFHSDRPCRRVAEFSRITSHFSRKEVLDNE